MPPISAKRKIDAVLTVCQNNREQTVDITAANRAAERLIGKTSEQLEQESFTSILPQNLRDMIENYVEYDASGGRDLASVLRKMLHFSVLNNQGANIPVSLKVFYVLSEDTNPCYELLMRDNTLIKQLEELKKESLESQQHFNDIDSQTNLPRTESLARNVSLVTRFVDKSNIEATFAIVTIDHMDKLTQKYGESAFNNIITHVGALLRKACREEDTVAYLGEGKIALILLDCNEEDANSVLNRYRLKINNSSINPVAQKPDSLIHISPSIGFKEIKPGDTLDQLLQASNEALKTAQNQGGDKVFGH
jgi:diguanylate cyclase (GGDEF)-like protein/PAS domain S-box-containing protein